MVKKLGLAISMTLVMLVSMIAPVVASGEVSIYVSNIVPDQTLTVRTSNFPKSTWFLVYIGYYGTGGKNGTAVGRFNSGDGATLEATVTIPMMYWGERKLDVLVISEDGGYAATATGRNGFDNGIAPNPRNVDLYLESITPNVSIKVTTLHLPPNTVFLVRMGKYGSNAVGGYEVLRFNSGDGNVMGVSIPIPPELSGVSPLDVRMDAIDGTAGILSFTNVTGGKPIKTSPSAYWAYIPGDGYSGIPNTTILSVVPDTSVTMLSNNLPPNTIFTVRMGPYGSYGAGGEVVGSIDTSAGTSNTQTFPIPASLKGATQIAIRIESSRYFAYDWFNNVASTSSSGSSTSTGGTYVPSSYTGYPYTSIGKVVKDTTVTVNGYNFPPNMTFTVTIGAYGTLGVGGVVVGSLASGAGGTVSGTYNIPAAYAGAAKLAIRFQGTPYYAYDWFNNTTTP